MNNALLKIKRFLKQIVGFLPSPLPVGATEFSAWADDLVATYSLPTFDKDSIKFAIATTIMHLGPTAAYKSKWYFVLVLRAGAAKQIAAGEFQEIKLRHQAAQQAAQTPSAEVTALSAPSVGSA